MRRITLTATGAVVLALLLVVVSMPADAQEWGISDSAHISLPAFAFTGFDAPYDGQILAYNHVRYCGDFCLLAAPVALPAGAQVTAIAIDGYDADASGRVIVGFHACAFQSDSCSAVGDAGTDNPYVGGNAALETVFAVPQIVDNTGYSYQVWALLAGGTDQTRLRSARLSYNLQIAPAPASATFADVPVGAFGFQHVEALAASGITGGCGGGNFCPNQPLTRVQMAVFLAKALGLHWPAGPWPPT